MTTNSSPDGGSRLRAISTIGLLLGIVAGVWGLTDNRLGNTEDKVKTNSGYINELQKQAVENKTNIAYIKSLEEDVAVLKIRATENATNIRNLEREVDKIDARLEQLMRTNKAGGE